MELTTIAMRQALRLPPESVADRLCERPDIAQAAAMYGGSHHGTEFLLHKDVRRALVGAVLGVEQAIATENGASSWKLTQREDGVALRSEDGPLVIYRDLLLLCADAAARKSGLRSILEGLRPGPIDAQAWYEKLERGPLSDAEFAQFHRELDDIPSIRLQRVRRSLTNQSVWIKDLIPSGRGYFECLVGAARDGVTADRYFGEVLLPHLSEVLERDSEWGWRCTLAAYSGPSIDVARVISALSDDVLLELLKTRTPNLGSPLAAVGVVAAATSRRSDQRFEREALDAFTEIVRRAGADQRRRPESALFSRLYRATLHCLNTDTETWSRPAYWRRLAAWAHAHILLDQVSFEQLDPKGFTTWLESQLPLAGDVIDMFDLQTDPLHLPNMEHARLGELFAVGLARTLIDDSSESGEPLPDLGQHELELSADLLRVWSGLPDLLQGRSDPSSDSPFRSAAETLIDEVMADASINGVSANTWNALLLLARLIKFEDQKTRTLGDAIGSLKVCQTADDFTTLRMAALVAVAQGSDGMANALARKVREGAAQISTWSLAHGAWATLCTAAAAYRDAQASRSWLLEQLIGLAYELPRGDACASLAEHCELMERFTRLGEQSWLRPAHIARSALA